MGRDGLDAEQVLWALGGRESPRARPVLVTGKGADKKDLLLTSSSVDLHCLFFGFLLRCLLGK